MKKKISDADFLRIVTAACAIGDGRHTHIKNYKRLLAIIAKSTRLAGDKKSK